MIKVAGHQKADKTHDRAIFIRSLLRRSNVMQHSAIMLQSTLNEYAEDMVVLSLSAFCRPQSFIMIGWIAYSKNDLCESIGAVDS